MRKKRIPAARKLNMASKCIVLRDVVTLVSVKNAKNSGYR